MELAMTVFPFAKPLFRGVGAQVYFIIIVCAIGLTGSSLLFGQTATTTQRQVPAPWRPAFGNVAKQAGTPIQQPAAQNPGQVTPQTLASQTQTNPQPMPQRTPANPDRSVAAGVPSSLASSSGIRATPSPGTEITQISSSLSSLPNDAGQVWREYDIRPYTSQIKTSSHPEKAILDWILLETGTEMWFSPPLGILNATKDKLFVYHTPEIHKAIKPIVDRFVYRKGELQSLEVHLVTVSKPNWRSEHYSILQPIDVPSPGVEAWMVSKENAALLMGQLAKRPDFQSHGGGQLNSHDGQKFVMEKRAPKQFVRSVRWVPDQIPSYQPLLTQVNEGFSLDIACLTSLDGKSMEACIRCDVDQVEKLNTVKINVPSITGGPPQKLGLQIPEIISWRLRERIRWPSDQVLLLNVGVVANPTPENGRALPAFLGANASRADALLFLEYQGPAIDPNFQHAAAGGTTTVAPVQPRR